MAHANRTDGFPFAHIGATLGIDKNGGTIEGRGRGEPRPDELSLDEV